jgi:hypothetical protein
MARKACGGSVSEVTGETGSCLNSLFQVLFRSVGVSEANHDPMGHCFLDERNGSFHLRCQGDAFDPAFAYLLKFLQFLPLGRPDKFATVNSPGPLFRRYIGAFEVDSETHFLEERNPLEGV